MSSKKKAIVTDNYCEGSIRRIKLENVLTYDSVEFVCGPHLNVVIGPNGTGKSTIVCAILLGLAGKTSWLGRAQQPSEYIKYGQNKAKIELELYNSDGDNWIICRDISKDNTSKWSVNGRTASQKSVEELVGRLNIQVGNLTQFLPQEKVADFAKMSEFELLENTEKAVGDPEMYARHLKLKESQTNAKGLEQEYTNLVDRLAQEQQKNSRIEQDVKNFEERENYLTKIKTLNMKRAWVEYEEKRQLYIQTKGESVECEKVYKAAKSLHAPLQRKLDDAKRQKEQIDTYMKTKTLELKEVAKQAEANGKDVDNLTDKFLEIQDELKLKKDQEEARKKRLKDLKKQLEALENDLRNTDDSEDLQPSIDAVNRKMREVTQQMGHINHQGDGIRMEIDSHRRNVQEMQKNLKVLRNIENQRLESLRNKHKDTYDAVMWLRQNKQMFKGAIYEPIMLCVNMKNPKMAKYLENHISFNDMRAFVCDNTEDFNLFMDTMRDQQNLRVNAVKTPANMTLNSCKPKVPITNYKQYGFQNYLQEMFTCPEAVMKFLCAQYRVQNIPVGDHRTKEMVDRVTAEQPDLSCFYTAENQYIIKKSRYDGSVASRNMRLKDASILTVSTDENREKELLQQLEIENEGLRGKEDLYHQLQQQSKQLDQQLNTLRDEKKQLMTKKDQKKKLQSQIESKKQTIGNVEAEMTDLETEEKKVAKKIKDINMKKAAYLHKYLENTRKCVAASTEKVRLSLRHADAVRQYSKLETEIREQSQSLQQAEAAYERIKEQLSQCKMVAKRLLEVAKKATGTGPKEELADDDKKLFEDLPNTLDDIDALIHEHQVRADCTVQTDKRVVQEYNRRKQDIIHLQKQLEDKELERDGHQASIEETRQLWMEPLLDLVTRINKSFSHFFQCLKCVGEIDLHKPDNPEEYSKYGIRIRVKFRDTEPLRELSAHHQSGGERSVTTVLYMMALQELAKCPFRCVDEINQGMDPTNERKVFELVVKTVCSKSSSQYFLLTPKLLPDLEYVENMTVLCVCNGQQMLNHTDWNLRKFIRRRTMLED